MMLYSINNTEKSAASTREKKDIQNDGIIIENKNKSKNSNHNVLYLNNMIE